MALTLNDVITAARDRSPWFHKTRVPNAVIARFLTDYQNELIGKAVQRDPQYLTQRVTVAFDFDSNNAVGTAGAGTTGGVPGTIASDGSYSTVEATAGSLIDPKLTSAGGAVVAVAERVVTSATTTTVTSTGAGRTTNGDAGKILTITAGVGEGQSRSIISNTATTWTISTGSDGLEWDTTPDTSSMMTVVDPAYESDLLQGVVTDLPATTSQRGYLVKLTSGGVPYIDWSAPVVSKLDAGIPLPQFVSVVGGVCRYTDDTDGPLYVISESDRYEPPTWPAVFVIGTTLYCCGEQADWTDVANLEVRYVPIAPAFAALTDYFLVPDAARQTLVAQAAAFMAERVQGMDEVNIDPAAHLARAVDAERAYLGTVLTQRRGRISRQRDIY